MATFTVGRRRLWGVAVGVAAVGLLLPTTSAWASIRASGSLPEFDSPAGLVVAGGNLWVANEGNSSLTEIDPSTGNLVAQVTGGHLDHPVGLTNHMGNLYVLNGAHSITERTMSGRLIAKHVSAIANPVAITKTQDDLVVLDRGKPTADPAVPGSVIVINFKTFAASTVSDASMVDPTAMVAVGSHLYVADESSNSVTDIDLSNLSVAGVITDPGIAGPDGIAASHGSVWVADSATNAATQIDVTNDSVVQTVNSGSYGFSSPSVAIGSGGNIFIASPWGSSPMVTKLSATTGAGDWYMCNTNGPYYFSDLSAFAVNGPDLWVASSTGANNPLPSAATGSLTELMTTTGALVRTLPAS
jgi:hypothetical protein